MEGQRVYRGRRRIWRYVIEGAIILALIGLIVMAIWSRWVGLGHSWTAETDAKKMDAIDH